MKLDHPIIAVDPYLITAPCPCQSQDIYENYVEGLLSYSNFFNLHSIKSYLSDECICAMIDDGVYPLRQIIENIHSEYEDDIDHFDKETILKILQNIFEKISSLEDKLCISDILYDEDTFIFSPNIYSTRLPPLTGKAFLKQLVMAGLAETCSKLQGGFFIASTSCTGDREVLVEGEIIYAETSWHLPTSLPIYLRNFTPFFFNENELASSIDSLGLLDASSSKICIQDAIKLRIILLEGICSIKSDDVISFSLGDSFFDSVIRWGFLRRSDLAFILVDSCARILAGIPRNKINPFRTNSSSTSPQRKREIDNSLAYRVHLTKHGPGFRLMYWRKSDGSIEFANVGDKDELQIF